jgi:hypothetical protein
MILLRNYSTLQAAVVFSPALYAGFSQKMAELFLFLSDLATRLDVIQIVRIRRSDLYKNSWQLSIHVDCIRLLLN